MATASRAQAVPYDSYHQHNMCRFLIQHTNLFCAWLFNLVYSSALVLLSTWCVVVKAPQAGGAGVAEVMAYLNGCQLPKVIILDQQLAEMFCEYDSTQLAKRSESSNE